jgi:isopenicillin-N epimerase
MDALKSLFMLDPGVIFLNHGSFGATPRPVFQSYQEWQRRLEMQPVKFLGREFQQHMGWARGELGAYLGADPSDLVFIPNATFGVNIVARSLDFQRGDEVLIGSHEYGACENVWSFIALKEGVKIARAEIPLPLPRQDEIADLIWEAVNPRTKLIFLSQISSPTAVRLPVEEICRKGREQGIPVMIDGAHVPGQLELNLKAMGADFYTGNCHKWLLSPKGSAFLHVRPERQGVIQPLVVSWGWGENCPYQSETRFLELLEWWGTKDPAAYLSVPAAIEFQRDHGWDEVRVKCQQLLTRTLDQIQELTGSASIYSDEGGTCPQMGAVVLPPACQPERLQRWLYEEHRIEIPVIQWDGRWLIRPSVQGYNTADELDQLVDALGMCLRSA